MPRPIRCVSIALLSTIGASHLGAQTEEKTEPPAVENIVVLEKFVANESGGDGDVVLPTRPSNSVLGIDKPPVETPRSLTIITGALTDQFAITNLADLSRFAPNTDTSFSFGIQGAISIRGDSSDAYFDGMKRLNNAANMPTAFGATDGLVIVKGPPSAIYGAGQVGGYVDYLPKTSVASATGEYLKGTTGQSTVYVGSYNERKASIEQGGPLTLFGKKGGYYLYGQYEDDGSYYIGSFTRMSLVQGSLTLDLTPKIRLKTGFNSQYYRGTGLAGWNRVTQDLIDNRNYITGIPLNPLDANHDGIISRAEILAQKDLNFTIPFVANNPKLPALPAGFALDPATVGTVKLDPRRVLIERDAFADDLIGFTDLTANLSPSFTFREKTLFEYQHHHKTSDIAYARAHEASVVEEKFILEHKPLETPSFVKFDTVAATSARYLKSYNTSTLGEQIFSRWDLTSDWMNDPSSPIIASANEQPVLAGPESSLHSQHVELGFGVNQDSVWWKKLDVDLGGRIDTVYADVFQNQTNTQSYLRRWAWNHGLSHSESVSYALFGWLHPYVTNAREKTIIPGAAGGIAAVASVGQGVLAASRLQEVGVKASALHDTLYGAFAYYDQARGSFNATLNQFQFTRGDGYEAELHWAPSKHWTFSASANWQEVYSVPETTRTNVLVSPQWAGYSPAQVYGGLIKTTIPATPYYQPLPGLPHTVENFFATFNAGHGFGFNVNVTHYSQFAASIVHDITLPSATPVSAGIGYAYKKWSFMLSARNLFNELYFQSNAATAFGDMIVIPMPGRTWELKVSNKF